MKKISILNIAKMNQIRMVFPGLVVAAISVIIIINGFFEFQRSKSELNDLMKNQARSILKTIIVSSQNTLLSENLEAKNLFDRKKTTNLDFLIDQLIRPGEIVYYALQNYEGVVISSANVGKLDNINQSSFLTRAINEKKFISRTYNFNGRDVFEAVQIFEYKGSNIGILRIGLSLTYLNELNSKAFNRILINSAILLAGGIILVIIISLRKNYQMLKKQYRAVETLSGDVIKTVSDAVIVYDEKNEIKVFNKAAEELFELRNEKVIGINIYSILNKEKYPNIFNADSSLVNVDCRINDRIKNLLISGDTFYDENKNLNTVLIIRDLTDIKKLEMQLQRKERLTAMGALASGVAHEIRNPLNSIGTIAQQLNKDFEPSENKDEFHKLASIIYGEVKRINETVTNFLRFSKPDPMQVVKFNLSDLFNEVLLQYKCKLEDDDIILSLNIQYDPEVFWDKDQIRQVIVNLINNSRDAIDKRGEINISVNKSAAEDRKVEIKISDNGKGIPDEIKNKIFNLYFTTKASGTGIGLSIVQKIIDEHNGLISVESGSAGTTFILQLPDKVV